MLGKLLQSTGPSGGEPQSRARAIERMLIKRESEIGGKLFGPVSNGGRREFFCLDEYTWIWYEEWLDKDNIRRVRTTRYEVRPNGVVKAQDGRGYQKLTRHEAKRFKEAVIAYNNRIQSEIYSTLAH